MLIRFDLITEGARESHVEIDVTEATIAGWAGRDRAKMEEHILELEALGVKRPEQTPTFYPVSAARLSRASVITCLGEHSSGEAEVVFLGGDQDEVFVGIGSDHTDRHIEAYDVAVSKQVCDKPVGGKLWRLRDVVDHWDALILSSDIEQDGTWTNYQEGTVGDLLAPGDLFNKYDGGTRLPTGTAMFGGTLPAKGGVRASRRFRARLTDPVLDRSLELLYNIESLPWRAPQPDSVQSTQ
ncbi:MAG: DUF2848 domain-containing protein [Oricola sp.]|nr:MAG: DUF2848 domain-containing protein [Oricola sp.]